MSRSGNPKARKMKQSSKVSTKGRKQLIFSNTNLGTAMNKYKGLDEVLWEFTANTDFVYEDMDFTVEEFSDISGCDIHELLEALNKVASEV